MGVIKFSVIIRSHKSTSPVIQALVELGMAGITSPECLAEYGLYVQKISLQIFSYLCRLPRHLMPQKLLATCL